MHFVMRANFWTCFEYLALFNLNDWPPSASWMEPARHDPGKQYFSQEDFRIFGLHNHGNNHSVGGNHASCWCRAVKIFCRPRTRLLSLKWLLDWESIRTMLATFHSSQDLHKREKDQLYHHRLSSQWLLLNTDRRSIDPRASIVYYLCENARKMIHFFLQHTLKSGRWIARELGCFCFK